MAPLDSHTLPPGTHIATVALSVTPTTLVGQPVALRTLLLDLLPADGTPVPIRHLAGSAGVATWHVTEALIDDYMAARLEFDLRADTFRRNPAKPL